MAVSSSVWNPLSLSLPPGANCNSRHGFGRQRSIRQKGKSCSHYCVCGPGLSTGDLNGRVRSSLVSGRRLSSKSGRGQEERVIVRAAEKNSSNESSEADVEALEARLGVGRRARKQQQSDDNPQSKQRVEVAKPKQPAKPWDSMSLAEKAWSLYIDPEKGILFWLNKLAYGAIFAVIGSWIVFRFIGPALGWYQLDEPLLSPDRLLDGGP